jgi:hypothetical protein
MYGWNTTEENEEINMRHEEKCVYRTQLMYYTISRAFIGIPDIIVLYSSPSILFKNNPSPQPKQ